MRHSIAGRATVVGTAARAMASLFASATFGARVREVGVFNTSSSAVAVALAEFTNATGVGAGLTETNHDINPTQCTGFAGHTADGGIGGTIRQASLGAAIGSGSIWTFGDSGFLIPIGTANGIGLICPIGTGQICDYYLEWDE